MILTGFPQPPLIVMNPQAQAVMEILMGLCALIGVSYLCREAIRHKTWLPVMLILGTFPAVFYEPLTDLLGLCIYPQIGQHTYIQTFGRKIPIYLMLAWLWYFGPFVWFFKKLFDRGIPAAVWWKIYIGSAIGCTVFELLPLHYELWHYYGAQPLVLLKMPIWWGLVNPVAIIGPGYVFHRLGSYLQGPRVLLAIPLLGMSISGIHVAASLPVSSALNTNYGTAVTLLGAILSVMVTILICGFCFNDSDSRAALRSQ